MKKKSMMKAVLLILTLIFGFKKLLTIGNQKKAIRNIAITMSELQRLKIILIVPAFR